MLKPSRHVTPATATISRHRFAGRTFPRYVFRLYALDAEPELRDGATKAQVEETIDQHVLTTAELVGTYER